MALPLDDIQSIRSRIANSCLVGVGIAALPALAGSLSRIFDTGWLPVMGLHIVLTASVIAAALLRRHLPYGLRAGYLVALFFIIGLGGLATLGIMSGPQLFFLAASILAFFLFGSALGFIIVGLGLAALIVAYSLLARGILPSIPEPIAYIASAGGWITAGTSLALTATVIGISLVEVFRSMIGSIEHVRQQNAEMKAEVAERQRAEAARLDQDARAQAIVDHAPAVIFIKDRNGRFLMVNQGFQEQYKVSAADVIGQTDAAVVSPALAALFRRRDLEVLSNDAPQELEHVDETEQGRRIYSTVRFPVRNHTGQVYGVCGIAIDITERKRVERAAEDALASLRDAIDSINQAIVLWDSDDRIAVFNQRYADTFFGIPAIGLHFEDFIRAAVAKGMGNPAPGQEEALVAERLAIHRKANGIAFVETLPDGRKLNVVRTPSRAGGIVSVVTDITEQLITEAQLREMQKMEAIGKLTGGMAHDFNNYLAVIIGNLDLLQNDGITGADAMKLLDQALAGALRAAELTQSLLAFSRNQPLEPSSTDVSRRLTMVASLLERTLGEDIVLRTELADDLWSVKIDGPQLDSSIVNLANNARDAMPDGGTLLIVTRNVRFNRSQARTSPEMEPGEYVLVEVGDTGTGIPPELIAHIFEPFFTTKRSGHGTGLGLSMVYGYVKQSGGHIFIDSKVGQGTRVRIYLPREKEDLSAVPPTPASSTPHKATGGMETVLLVEDNPQMRRTALAQLRSLGYRVIEAADGEAALDIVEQKEIHLDLLLSDIVMPGRINGYELAKLALERRPGLKVLLSSGYTGNSLPAGGIEGQNMMLLAKPYRLSDLAKAVRAALDSVPSLPAAVS